MKTQTGSMSSEQYPKVYLYRRIVQAKMFIDRHYADEIDLDNIADEAWFSKFHFIRLFKSSYGKTPHQYLQAVRIHHAQLLLKEDKSVSDACFSVGFQSLTTFSGLFKRSPAKPHQPLPPAIKKRGRPFVVAPCRLFPDVMPTNMAGRKIATLKKGKSNQSRNFTSTTTH